MEKINEHDHTDPKLWISIKISNTETHGIDEGAVKSKVTRF